MSDIKDRNSYITWIPNFGNDPLTDKLANKLTSLPTKQTYVVPKRNEFRPDKIAALFFSDSSYYWVILEYNKLGSVYDLLAGKTISIPDQNYLSQLLVSVNTVSSSQVSIYIK